MLHAFICTISISYTKPTKSQKIPFSKKIKKLKKKKNPKK